MTLRLALRGVMATVRGALGSGIVDATLATKTRTTRPQMRSFLPLWRTLSAKAFLVPLSLEARKNALRNIYGLCSAYGHACILIPLYSYAVLPRVRPAWSARFSFAVACALNA